MSKIAHRTDIKKNIQAIKELYVGVFFVKRV